MATTLTSKQAQAVTMVQDCPVSILCGAPGVGKTFTCNEIIKEAKKRNETVLLAAPSGKAAKRLSEATGCHADTIHKLLGAQMDGSGSFCFSQDRDNPLDAGLIILDEVSMVSNNLMCDFLHAVNGKTKVLFVGDQYQLPSVGPGAVLRDFLASGKIPCTELTEIQRNAGDIVKACHQIKEGKNYIPSPELDLEQGLNLRHIEIQSAVQIKKAICKLVTERMPARGYDPIWGVQVLSPTNKTSDISCKAINTVLQEKLNPNPPVDGIDFRKGDIMFLAISFQSGRGRRWGHQSFFC